MTDEMWTACQNYATRVGRAEYEDFVRHRKRKSERFRPSEYLSQLCELLGKDDEEGFKALKMEQGYASKLGV